MYSVKPYFKTFKLDPFQLPRYPPKKEDEMHKIDEGPFHGTLKFKVVIFIDLFVVHTICVFN